MVGMSDDSRESSKPDDLIEQIESEIPDERKNLSFGGEGESIIDVMDRADEDAHKRGLHEDEPRADCPLCEVDSDE